MSKATVSTALGLTLAISFGAGMQSAVADATLAQAKNWMACHAVDKKLVGPAYKEVAAKYKDDAGARETLIGKVKQGGSGNWGAIPMPPNPAVSDEDVATLVDWILAQE